jgi:small basic protein
MRCTVPGAIGNATSVALSRKVTSGMGAIIGTVRANVDRILDPNSFGH